MFESYEVYRFLLPPVELKKDPGIPNLYPFKEQLLKQIEDKKQRAEEERARQKQQRQREQNKKRSLQGLQNDAQKRTREFEKKVVVPLLVPSWVLGGGSA